MRFGSVCTMLATCGFSLVAIHTFTAQMLAAQQVVAATQVSRTGSAELAKVLTRPVSVRFDGVALEAALERIAAQANIRINYRMALVEGVKDAVTLRADNMQLGEVLDKILSANGLYAVVTGQDLVTIKLMTGTRAVALQGSIAGKVVHEKTKQPIAGATVSLDGVARNITTNTDGTFRIPAPAGEYTLHIRAVGFSQQSKSVTVVEGQSVVVDIALNPSTSVLDEVIVTGTVIATERKAIPNPITVITAADIERRGITRIEEFFRGEVPGVIALDLGSQPYYGGGFGQFDSLVFGGTIKSQIYARGSGGLGYNQGTQGAAASTNPLKTYVDGVEIVDPSYLGTIDTRSIERIEIITGPQAATIYGSGALGGVMQIFTKSGAGTRAPEITLAAKYGMLQNNLRSGKTPRHNHALSLLGGNGLGFSYSGNLSYNYSGQWQPFLFSEQYGASIGATHTSGPVVVRGAVSMTQSQSGTSSNAEGELLVQMRARGELSGKPEVPTQRKSGSKAYTMSFNADYRPFPFWSHQLSVGRNQVTLDLEPKAPRYDGPGDSLYQSGTSVADRTTLSYSTTIQHALRNLVSSTLTLGANRSDGDQLQMSGCTASPASTAYIACWQNTATNLSRSVGGKSTGIFGTWRLGVFESLYVTLGLRGEKNPNYGNAHKVDWTPTNGITYTIERGAVSLKLLGSYGSATKEPTAAMRQVELVTTTYTTPATYVWTLEAPYLRPEHSRGPQGGLELYVGNLGSLTVNRYMQKVTDLLQRVYSVDSVLVLFSWSPDPAWVPQGQWQNVAVVRQNGWESTGLLNLGRFSVRGTYSWNDSWVDRVLTSGSDRSNAGLLGFHYPGMRFNGVPSHTGNFTIGYAAGATSVMLATNYIGSSTQADQNGNRKLAAATRNLIRLQMYMDQRSNIQEVAWTKPSYTKSDLSVSHRLTPALQATLNMTNMFNDFGSDVSPIHPTLGRQMLFGISWKFARAQSM